MTLVDLSLGGVSVPRARARRSIAEASGLRFAELMIGPERPDDAAGDSGPWNDVPPLLLDVVQPGTQLLSMRRTGVDGVRRQWVGLLTNGMVHSFVVDAKNVLVGPGVEFGSFIESQFGPFSEDPLDDPVGELVGLHHGTWLALAWLARQSWYVEGRTVPAHELVEGFDLDPVLIAQMVEGGLLSTTGHGTYGSGPLLDQLGPSVGGERITMQVSDGIDPTSDRRPIVRILRLLRHGGRWHALTSALNDGEFYLLVPCPPEVVILFVAGIEVPPPGPTVG